MKALANQCLCVPRTLSPSTLSSFQFHNIAWVITVIYTLVLALSLNQIDWGLMTQIFRVTLPTSAEHKLRGGVVLCVLIVRLASDSFSDMNLCRSGPPHAEWLQNPSDWCPRCGHSSHRSYLSLIHGGLWVKQFLQWLLVTDEWRWRCGKSGKKRNLLTRN